jgi:hypothetical protein
MHSLPSLTVIMLFAVALGAAAAAFAGWVFWVLKHTVL